ncbi:MAG TPA: carboxylating nicotinate-nucleotide diphosphorylase [Stenomitos sp.]
MAEALHAVSPGGGGVLHPLILDPLLTAALQEDWAWGDLTTQTVVPTGSKARAEFLYKAPGVVAGLPIVQRLWHLIDPTLVFTAHAAEGATVANRTVAATVEGDARAILSGERVALNLMQRLSATATLAAAYVQAVTGTRAEILDTRKTTPGLRLLEKYAVRVGGARNHRFGLADAIMIKDNHIEIAGSITEAVRRARQGAAATTTVEVETESLEMVEEALAAGADIIMLDNMDPGTMRRAVSLVAGRARLEASGGVTLQTVRAIAETGVDFISVGALTHSAGSLDISLDMKPL